MRYPPEQVERLAAEYAIGTLHSRARRRFDALMRDRSDVRLAVWRWERRLDGLYDGLKPVDPPASTWRRIRYRVNVGSGVSAKSSSETSGWWPRFATLAITMIAVAFWLGTNLSDAPTPDRVAVFSDPQAQALWVITAEEDTNALIAETAGVPARDDDRVYQLWALPAEGQPRSLGLLNTAAGRYELPAADDITIAALNSSASLAISLEPPGGSPTGLPTGPVVYQATLARL